MNKEPSEIAKLTERISKDPKSKLFVPLAEEYKKDGDIEMAIHVLSEGLKHNPGYVTARSILGRLLFDKGDYEGARKEFEEVVKAIPDNLLAQRKLGDVYALKNSKDEALLHYKIAAALNPGDEELSSLMAEIEAERDVHTRILQQKPRPASEPVTGRDKQPPPSLKPKAKPEFSPPETAAPAALKGPAASAASKPGPAPREAAAPVQPAPEKPDHAAKRQKTEGENAPAGQGGAVEFLKTSGPSAPSQSGGTDSAGLQEVREEPEEILFVEPIEDEVPAKEETVSGFDAGVFETFERTPEKAEEHVVGATGDVSEVLKAETPIFDEAQIPGLVEEEAPAEIEAVPEMAAPEESVKTADQSDDFTTDTLAELYIAQGFFEKAIDIYERMMADHPTSQALKDKLARVREMASFEEPQEQKQESPAASDNVPAGAGTGQKKYSPPAAQMSEEEDLTPKRAKAEAADFLSEAVEYVPPPSVPEDEILTIDAVEVDPEHAVHPQGGAALSEETALPEEEDITLDAELFVEHEEPAAPKKATGKRSPDSVFAEREESKPQEDLSPPAPRKAQPVEEGSSEASFDIFMTSPAQKSGIRPLYTDFEPREYVPPAAEPAGDAVQAAPAPSIASRKETLDRLETWLKNIRKEK